MEYCDNGIIQHTGTDKYNRNTNAIHVHLNTLYRDNLHDPPENSNFTFSQAYNNIVGMKLLNIEIASTWYMITERNQTFYLRIRKKNDVLEEIPISISEGNYTLDTFLEEINKKITLALDDYASDITISVDTDERTLKIIFNLQYLNDLVKYIEIIFCKEVKTRNEVVNSLGWIMGYRTMEYIIVSKYYNYNGTNKDSLPRAIPDGNFIALDDNKFTQKSESLFNGSRDRYIYFVVDDYQSEQSLNNIVFNDEVVDRNVLGKIFLCEGGFGLNMREYSDSNTILIKRFKREHNIRKINVKILDQCGELLDLNNMNFSFSLEFIQVFNYLSY